MVKEKVKEKDVKDSSGDLIRVPIEQFRRSSDQIMITLNELQSNLQVVQTGLTNMMTVYLRHSQNIMEGNAMEQSRAPATAEEAGGKKRGRPKKPKDPNAPKRPLTAAFLYAQNARPVVKKDLESELAPGETLVGKAVQRELNRRWEEMPDSEKELWKESYRESMKFWAKEMKDYEAKQGIVRPTPDVDDVDADVGALPSDIDASSDDDSEEESPIRTKAATPPAVTPKSSKRSSKAAKTNGVVPPPIVPMRSSVPVPVPSSFRATSVKPPSASPAVENGKSKRKHKDKEASPEESKKKRARRNATEEAEVETPTVEPPKKKKKSKA